MNVFTRSSRRSWQLCKCEAFASRTSHGIHGWSIGYRGSTAIAAYGTCSLDHFLSCGSESKKEHIRLVPPVEEDLSRSLLAHSEHELNGSIDQQTDEAQDNADGLTENQWKEWWSKTQALQMTHVSEHSHGIEHGFLPSRPFLRESRHWLRE